MATQPTDFLSSLGGINALPNAARDISMAQGLHTTELQQQAMGLQNQTRQLQLNEAQTAQQRQQAFQTDLMGLGDDPSPQAIARTIRKYPEYATQLKQSHDIQDEAKRTSDFRLQSQVYSAANTGQYGLASKLLKSHRDASVKAGEEVDPVDEAIITALESGDPAEQKRALSMIGLAVAAIDPDKFAQTYKALQEPADKGGVVVGDGSALVDPITGKVLFQAPRKPEYRSVGAGETVVALGGSPGSAGAPTGDVIEGAVLGIVPGAVVTSRARTPEHNREVGGVPNSRHLDDAARDFAPPEGMSTAALAKQVRASLPSGYRVLDEGDHIHVQAATRGGGGAQIVAQGGPKAEDAPSGYRWGTGGALEAIPGGPADKGRSGGGKAIPQWAASRAEPKYEAARGLEQAVGSFQDAYGGHTILGEGANSLQSLTGAGAAGQRDWWAQFASLDNQIRNKLFGSALTDSEKAAYNRTTITPRMQPAQIRKNLNTRLDIAKKAVEREAKFMRAQGYDDEAVADLLSVAPSNATAPAKTAAPTGFRILSVRPK